MTEAFGGAGVPPPLLFSSSLRCIVLEIEISGSSFGGRTMGKGGVDKEVYPEIFCLGFSLCPL